MPKNLKGGKGHKRLKNNVHKQEKQLLYKEDSVLQEYGIITESFGTGMKIKFIDSKGDKHGHGKDQSKICHGQTRGKLKKYRFHKGDVVLICRREYQDDIVDVIHKYEDREINRLKYEKEINSLLLKDIKDTNKRDDDEEEEVDFIDDEEDLSLGYTQKDRARNARREHGYNYDDLYRKLDKGLSKYDDDDDDDDMIDNI